MIYVAIGCFLFAALFGIILLIYVLNSKETPKALALAHGAFAASGLILLLIYAVQKMNNTLWIAGFFIIVAVVGFYMFFQDMTGKQVPKMVALIHGTVAAAGLITLIFLVLL